MHAYSPPMLLLVLSTTVASITPVCAQESLQHLINDDKQWVSPRKDYFNQGYSRLAQIHHGNVQRLRQVWSFSTGISKGHEGAPLVVGHTMLIHTAFPNNVYALDLDQAQKIIWSYHPRQASDTESILCCDSVNRGLAYADGKVLLQQNNGVLVALDLHDGHLHWQAQVNDIKQGASNTNAPYVFRDKVLTGCSGGEFGVRCFLAAYALKDGSLQWKAYSTGPDEDVLIGAGFNRETPHYSALSAYEDVAGGNREGGSFKALPKDRLKFPEDNLGVRSWLKPQANAHGGQAPWQHGGGPVWGWFSYDPALNLVYYGTGNPSVWNPDIRPGDNKWAMTLFARDLDSGQARWGYQLTPHDEWDYDSVNELILWNHGSHKLATHFDRNGFAYTLARDTGTLLSANKMHPFVNWATGIDLDTGIPLKDARYATHQDQETSAICPSALGVKNMQPAAFSPQSGWFYVPLNHLCMQYEAVEAKYVAGQPWAGASITMQPGPEGIMGGFMAWDGWQGKRIWYKQEAYPVWSGALATAGRLVFYGTLDRWFKAVDARQGKELWRFQVGSGIVGNPMTYSHKGKQYIAVFSGIGGWAGVALNQGLSEESDGAGTAGVLRGLRQFNAAPGGGALNVFGL